MFCISFCRRGRSVLTMLALCCVCVVSSLQLSGCVSCTLASCSSTLLIELKFSQVVEQSFATNLFLEVETDTETAGCSLAEFSNGSCKVNNMHFIKMMPSAAQPSTHAKAIQWSWGSVLDVKRISIRSDGKELVAKEFTDRISPSKTLQPNGTFCAPTCHEATVNLSM